MENDTWSALRDGFSQIDLDKIREHDPAEWSKVCKNHKLLDRFTSSVIVYDAQESAREFQSLVAEIQAFCIETAPKLHGRNPEVIVAAYGRMCDLYDELFTFFPTEGAYETA